MTAGDITRLAFPITINKTTDDGVTPVIEAAAAMTVTDFDILRTEFIVNEVTKEGNTLGTVVVIGRKLT